MRINLKIRKLKNQWKMENGEWKIDRQGGQALIMLLFFILIGVTVTTAAIFIIATNSLAASDAEMGVVTRELADSGAENALLQVLRGNFAEENLTLPDGTVKVDITVTNGLPSLITSQATDNSKNYTKTVVVGVSYDNNNVMSVVSWKETN